LKNKMSQKPLKILMLGAEAAPLVKVGGLADVVGSLPIALKKRGHDVRVAIPHFSFLDAEKLGLKVTKMVEMTWADHVEYAPCATMHFGEVPFYFIGGSPIWRDKQVYRDGQLVDGAKFVFFALASLQLVHELNWMPDIVHVHDAHPGAAIYYLATHGRTDPFWANTASILTVHNLVFQLNHIGEALHMGGLLPSDDPNIPIWGRDGLMSLAVNYADMLNAVSPGYASEILTDEYGAGLQRLLMLREERLTGILNGLDYEAWNPNNDSALAQTFSVDDLAGRLVNKHALQAELSLPVGDAPLLGVVSRLDHQKGFDLASQTLPDLLKSSNAQLAILGTGQPEIMTALYQLQEQFPQRVSLNIKFDLQLAKRIYAGSDFFLMPSRYEPCGLGQLIAMRYGSVPVVRAVGGLRDTVTDNDRNPTLGTGFTFNDYQPTAFLSALHRALACYNYNPDVFRAIQKRAMLADFSWSTSAQKYEALYEQAMAYRRAEHGN
jgi:starch synthase